MFSKHRWKIRFTAELPCVLWQRCEVQRVPKRPPDKHQGTDSVAHDDRQYIRIEGSTPADRTDIGYQPQEDLSVRCGSMLQPQNRKHENTVEDPGHSSCHMSR